MNNFYVYKQHGDGRKKNKINKMKMDWGTGQNCTPVLATCSPGVRPSTQRLVQEKPVSQHLGARKKDKRRHAPGIQSSAAKACIDCRISSYVCCGWKKSTFMPISFGTARWLSNDDVPPIGWLLNSIMLKLILGPVVVIVLLIANG